MKLRLSAVLAASAASCLWACGPADPAGVQPTVVATASAGALEVELSTFGALEVGLNRMFYAVRQGGQAVDVAALVQRPVMNMPTMKHACPVVDPQDSQAPGQLEGSVVFTMASSETDSWDLFLDVTPQGAAAATTVRFEALPVAGTDARRSFLLGDVKYVLSLTLDQPPRLGPNPYTVTLHTSEMMGMRFAPVTDVEVQVTVERAGAGEGRAGNVDPAHAGQGLYRGQASFGTAGHWVLHVKLTRHDAELGSFDFPFEL